MPKQRFHFEASAKLQRLLGRELLPDDFSAVEELVKNAYDSNASEVLVRIQTAKPNALILVRDNGGGLDRDGFERHWMWAGYSDKTPKPLPVTGRVQTGEKGIGRFAADRLGSELTVLTKTQTMDRALKVDFKWREFQNQNKKLSDVLIPYEFVAPTMFGENRSGTVLRIEKLRSSWTTEQVQELRVRLVRLLTPLRNDKESEQFKIIFEVPSEEMSGPLISQEILEADFEWELERRGGTFAVLGRRRVTDEKTGLPTWTDWLEEAEGPAQTDHKSEFGPVRAKFFYFEKRPKKSQVGDALPGVAVYRDGLRVEPDGTHAADWLGLLEKRAKRAGHMPLVPSRLFGFVNISRKQNPGLADATNRRAFVRSPAYDQFVSFLKDRLGSFEDQVERYVAKPNWDKSTQKKATKLAEAGQKTLSMLSLGLAHELRQPLQVIRGAAENVAYILEKQGLLSEEMKRAMNLIQRNVERIDKQISFIKDLGVGRDQVESFRLDAVTSEVLDAFRERAKAAGITLEAKGVLDTSISFNRWTLLMVITNLVLNAFEAIRSSEPVPSPRIDVIAKTTSKEVQIWVTDNGPGIPALAQSRLFKRNTTSKQGGMGVALYIWRDVLRAFEADLECTKFSGPTTFVVHLPGKVRNG